MKNINDDKVQELLDYSFELLLVNVLYKNNEISESEYIKIKEYIEKEHLEYLNNYLKQGNV